MKFWFGSLTGAVILAFAALLAFLARTFIDFQFVYSEFASSTGVVAIVIILNTAFMGGWMGSLHLAARGKRGGLIATLIFILLFPLLIGIATLVTFCRTPCQTAGGLMEIANWTNLITGLLAAIAVFIQLWKNPARS